MEKNHVPSAENPEKLLHLKATGAKKMAAGIPAVLAALSDVIEEGIPFRGAGALFVMNQKGGFDRGGVKLLLHGITELKQAKDKI